MSDLAFTIWMSLAVLLGLISGYFAGRVIIRMWRGQTLGSATSSIIRSLTQESGP